MKSIQVFIHQQQHADTTDEILKKSVYRTLVQEKIKKIDLQLQEVLEELRMLESEKNTKDISVQMKLQQQHRKKLT